MIVTYDDSYYGKVKELIKGSQYYIALGENAETSVISVKDDEVIGVGSLWKNSLHPNREYIGIYISPEYRHEGIGTEIFDELYKLSPTKKFQMSISSSDDGARSFLNRSGFNLARKCYTPALTHPLFDSEKDYTDEGVTFKDLTEEQKRELLKLQLTNYKECHEPVNALNETVSAETWKDIIMDQFNEDHSYIYLKEGEVEAYVLSYKAENMKDIDIGYIGGKDHVALHNYLPFYKSVVNNLMKNVETVSIEADDVDPFASAMLNLFEYDRSISWDAYVLN